MRLRQLVLITPKCRSKMARNAANKRWSKTRQRKVRDRPAPAPRAPGSASPRSRG
jgi:hypothetical protein